MKVKQSNSVTAFKVHGHGRMRFQPRASKDKGRLSVSVAMVDFLPDILKNEATMRENEMVVTQEKFSEIRDEKDAAERKLKLLSKREIKDESS